MESNAIDTKFIWPNVWRAQSETCILIEIRCSHFSDWWTVGTLFDVRSGRSITLQCHQHRVSRLCQYEGPRDQHQGRRYKMVDLLGAVRRFLRVGVLHRHTDLSDSILFLSQGKLE